MKFFAESVNYLSIPGQFSPGVQGQCGARRAPPRPLLRGQMPDFARSNGAVQDAAGFPARALHSVPAPDPAAGDHAPPQAGAARHLPAQRGAHEPRASPQLDLPRVCWRCPERHPHRLHGCEDHPSCGAALGMLPFVLMLSRFHAPAAETSE